MAPKKKAAKKAESATAALEKWARSEIKQIAANVARLQKDLDKVLASASARAKPAARKIARKAKPVARKAVKTARSVKRKAIAKASAVAAKKPAARRKPARKRPTRKPSAS
jgi:ElaB/YqjD/DUF883 family membrane-anchored ribosome-binding protein